MPPSTNRLDSRGIDVPRIFVSFYVMSSGMRAASMTPYNTILPLRERKRKDSFRVLFFAVRHQLSTYEGGPRDGRDGGLGERPHASSPCRGKPAHDVLLGFCSLSDKGGHTGGLFERGVVFAIEMWQESMCYPVCREIARDVWGYMIHEVRYPGSWVSVLYADRGARRPR